ncbi:hypothetical protein P3T36_003153 [Kitasatospora sp. MAP12-15]|uniref:DUF4129 domain-containing protein n=1 Tax=unclassified Kitasatospora TaxID=2633591 RepID=UPI002475D79B|nr:DUF4129 domain-containing protein [Kitasatospora sp. MAP12-44]MDH6110784.1 hypothetical protein [Kitasatospora sp. MAP12-44]
MPTWGDRALAAAGSPVAVPRDPARDAARNELLDPAYHRHDPSLAQRVTDWLWAQLDHLLGGIGSTTGSGVAGLVFFLVIAVLIGAGLWWRLGRPGRAAQTAAALFSAEGPRTAAEHRAAARRHAEAGDWPQAVREQMRALVRALEERTLLDARPGRTADEAAAEAGRFLPEHAAALREAARVFDDVAFGDRAAAGADYQLLAELDGRLERTRPAVPSPGGLA